MWILYTTYSMSKFRVATFHLLVVSGYCIGQLRSSQSDGFCFKSSVLPKYFMEGIQEFDNFPLSFVDRHLDLPL